jgi:hypothetical protein
MEGVAYYFRQYYRRGYLTGYRAGLKRAGATAGTIQMLARERTLAKDWK